MYPHTNTSAPHMRGHARRRAYFLSTAAHEGPGQVPPFEMASYRVPVSLTKRKVCACVCAREGGSWSFHTTVCHTHQHSQSANNTFHTHRYTSAPHSPSNTPRAPLPPPHTPDHHLWHTHTHWHTHGARAHTHTHTHTHTHSLTHTYRMRDLTKTPRPLDLRESEISVGADHLRRP